MNIYRIFRIDNQGQTEYLTHSMTSLEEWSPHEDLAKTFFSKNEATQKVAHILNHVHNSKIAEYTYGISAGIVSKIDWLTHKS